MLLALTIALAAATLYTIDAAAPTVWEADLLTFIIPHIVAGFALLILLLAMRRRAALGLALLTAAITAAIVTAAPGNSTNADWPLLRVLTFNVLYSNHDVEVFRRHVEEVDPDVIVLQEMRQPWEVLKGWDAYPHYGRNGDVAILSRLPFAGEPLKVYDVTGGDIDGLKATRVELSVAGRPGADRVGDRIVFYGLHAPSPRVKAWWHERNAFLASVAGMVAKEPEERAIVMAGDWNTPPWSPFLRDFMARTGLALTEPSLWPATTRFMREYGLPTWIGGTVDHVLASRNLVALRHRVGPDIGSDHLPVTVDLAAR